MQLHTNRETAYTEYCFTLVVEGRNQGRDLDNAKIEWDVINVVGQAKKHISVHRAPGTILIVQMARSASGRAAQASGGGARGSVDSKPAA